MAAPERSRAKTPTASPVKDASRPWIFTAETMLRLATIDGARVGILRTRSAPDTRQAGDIAVIDMRSPHLDGCGDPVAVMVIGAGIR